MMKKLLAILAIFASASWAVDAFYRHHQRTTTTSLEADLVAREVGIDASARNSLIAKKADGNLIHVLAKEMDTASLSGVLNVTGTANFSSTVKMANYTSGRVPYFTTGGLITDASTFTYNGTTFATNSGTYSGTLGVTGNLTNTVLAGTGTRMVTATSAGLFGNATTIAGANTWSDVQTFTASPFVEYSNSGGTVGARISNTSNTASSEARLSLIVAGTSAGDPFVRYDVTGTTAWVHGVDNSVSGDPFVIAASGALGSSNAVSITTAGAMTVTSTVTADSIISSKFYTEGSFTAAATGFSACTQGALSGSTCTATAYYTRTGKAVNLSIPDMNGTSSTTALTITGLPAGIIPSRVQNVWISTIYNNSISYTGSASVSTGGVITPIFWTTSTNPTGLFTASGLKGFTYHTINYNLL